MLLAISILPFVHARSRSGAARMCVSGDRAVPITNLKPSAALSPREVITSVMESLHRSNWDRPTECYGFEVAMRFLAPTHAAKLKKANPTGFSRYLRQQHRIRFVKWNEYRFEGDVARLTGDDGVEEAFQMISLRSSPTAEWCSARFHLVLVPPDCGGQAELEEKRALKKKVLAGAALADEERERLDELKALRKAEKALPPQWMVEAIYSDEPDTPEDVMYLRSKSGTEAADAVHIDAAQSPRDVVAKVMRALRQMDEPTKHHGAVVATQHCSPRNRASELSPAVFAGYLQDPWYAILAEWDEMEFDDDEEEAETAVGEAEVQVLVRRGGDESFSMVSWLMSQHDERWLIDSLNIV
mmetsp:Transcript_15504/g.49923  ORF Transcript_15504/g.49923 Transcript_15504/m.49923 type:complete len:356 (-) Transcript_15504:221-1288(-)